MPWIQNVSLGNILKGNHNFSNNCLLIQIVDPGMEFPLPFEQFQKITQFKFFDLEERDACLKPEMKITDQQASELVSLLQNALDNNMDVVVHCVMGICRSGAVHEVGVMMGFKDTSTFRIPNLLVKQKMIQVLGWTYT